MITATEARAASREVVDLLTLYFDALYNSDAELLAEVLHPSVIYATANDGTLLRLSMDDYLPIVSGREAPAARHDVRTDAVESIEFAGPNTAAARVRCSSGPKHFTDLLTLVRLEGRWWVIAKVFSFELRGDDPAEILDLRTAGAGR
jgi:hypothetical protein